MDGGPFADALRDATAASSALDRIAGLAARFLRTPIGLVVIVGEGRDCIVGAGGPYADAAPEEQPLAYSLCQYVVEDAAPLVIANAVTDPRSATNKTVTEQGVASYAGMPLTNFAGQVVGSVCVSDVVARDWTAEELDTLRDLAESASTQLSFAALARDREEARAALEASTAFQNAVLDSLGEGVVACDAKGRLAYFNQSLRDIHGLSERAIGSSDWANAYDLYAADGEQVLHPDEIPLARAFDGQHVERQHMVVRAAGKPPKHFSASGGPIVGADGSPLGAVIAMRDITLEVRQQRVRRAELGVATALTGGLDDLQATCEVLAHLGGALDLSVSEYVELDENHPPLIGAIETARTTGTRVERPSAEHPGEIEFALPITTGGGVVGVLHLVGKPAELHDALGSSFVLAVTTMLGRWREEQRLQALQQELTATRATLGRVVEQINDFIFSAVLLPDGSTTRSEFSSSSAGILGGEIGTDINWDQFRVDRVHVDDHPAIDRYRAQLRAGEPAEMTIRMFGFDGRTRWVWVRSRRRLHHGRPYVDGVATDVTERQTIVHEREELLRTRNEQVDELQALDRVKDEFVATVGHEIRGPLGLLVTFADDVAHSVNAEDDPTTARKAGLVLANAEHLQQVVENIFDLARLDANGTLRTEHVRLDSLLADLAEQHAPAAAAAGVLLDVSVPAGLSVEADVSKLRQAIENLLSNSVKFSAGGGQVRLRAEQFGSEVVVTVRDDGIGIPAEDVPNLFTRFYRASNALTGATPGTGLGLAVTRTIVQAHGGSVAVASSTAAGEHGTTFTVRLPAS